MSDNEIMKRRAEWLNSRPSYVVLGQKSDGDYQGLVEHSFSMGISDKRVNIFWSSEEAVSNFGTTHVVNGEKDATYHLKTARRMDSNAEWKVYDLNSPECPIDIDWVDLLDAWTPASTLSGVKDKFRARNALFYKRSFNERISCT